MIENYSNPRFLTSEAQNDVDTTASYDITKLMIDYLWIFSAFGIITLNFVTFYVSIRDMWYQGYSPSVHWASSAVLVATIGGIVAIQNYIKK